MHIVLIVDCFAPSTKSAAKLTQDLANEFVNLGHKITVLTVSDTVAARCTVERVDDVTVCQVRTGQIKGARHALRAVNEILLSDLIWSSAGRFLRSLAVDLIVYYSPTIFFGRLVARLKALWGCPSYLILRDIFPDWALEAGVLKRGPAYSLFKYFERLNYHAADRIAVQSPANLTYMEQICPDHRVAKEVLYNWTTAEEPALSNPSYRMRLGLTGKVVFFFGGNIGVAQDTDNLLRLAERLLDKQEVRFLLVGEGSAYSWVASAITERKLLNVVLRPAIDQKEYLAMLGEFDVGLISLDRRLRSANVPGKLLGYLQCGLPTLASINAGNDLGSLLQDSGAGLVSINPNDDLLHRNALRLIQDANMRVAMGECARRLLHERFLVSAAAAQILRAFPPRRRLDALSNTDEGAPTIDRL